MSNVVRSTALRAGGACVRCRKGKTKCVYENGRAPCKNCAKGMHECYLPSESMAHHHGQSPARHTASHRPARESLPAASSTDARAVSSSAPSRHAPSTTDKYITPELLAECERVVSKTFPACVAFHKPSFIQQLKNGTMSPSLVFGLLTAGARSSPTLIRRYGNSGAGTPAAEHFATKAIDLINQNMDAPSLPDIQAMCLLIIHEWGTRNAVRAYIYLGMAARMVQMYRILNSHHQQSDSPDKFLQDESFRRTVWLLYILDSMLVSTPGRHPALTVDDVVDVSLPCTDINFAFGNPVYVKTLTGADPSWVKALTRPDQPTAFGTPSPQLPQQGEIGEFGHIVMATRIWRDTVSLLTTTTPATFRDELCDQLLEDVEHLRSILPMQFVNKPGQINLHITMGTGFTYAFLHTLLYCSHIFLYRRRLLHAVTLPDFDLETFRSTRVCQELIDQLFTSSHSTLAMLNAIETGADSDSKLCMPIFMLFAAFTASATVAYLSLKGLTPHNVVETAGHIVRDGLHFTAQGAESWPLTMSWNRHIAVMHRVLMSEGNQAVVASLEVHNKPTPAPGSVKDDAASNQDTSDVMDYDQQSNPPGNASQDARGESVGGEDARGESEPPLPLPRRPGGIATINGGSGGVSTPATVSPPPPQEVKHSPGGSVDENMPATSGAARTNGAGTPAPASTERAVHSGPSNSDMTPAELCVAFERQLLELDDLAAFMGGGV